MIACQPSAAPRVRVMDCSSVSHSRTRSGAAMETSEAPKVRMSLQTGSPPLIDAAKTTLQDSPAAQVNVSVKFPGCIAG